MKKYTTYDDDDGECVTYHNWDIDDGDSEAFADMLQQYCKTHDSSKSQLVDQTTNMLLQRTIFRFDQYVCTDSFIPQTSLKASSDWFIWKGNEGMFYLPDFATEFKHGLHQLFDAPNTNPPDTICVISKETKHQLVLGKDTYSGGCWSYGRPDSPIVLWLMWNKV